MSSSGPTVFLFVVIAQTTGSATPVGGSADPATNSGLIVFLPLVGAILGGIVGAVGGAWANSWYRDREAKKVEDRERVALLILLQRLAVELVHNLAGA